MGSKPIKKLVLSREDIKSLKVKSGLKTGPDSRLVSTGGPDCSSAGGTRTVIGG
jgi:hypothetical protein